MLAFADPILCNFIEDTIVPRFNYWVYIVLMMIGLYAMISKNNLVKKLIGMSIFQTAIILFYVSIGVKSEAGIPILDEADRKAAYEASKAGEPSPVDPARYANPLPHVLMLTAIVVGVSTLGLALAITQKIYECYGTVEEDEILAQLKTRTDREEGTGDADG